MEKYTLTTRILHWITATSVLVLFFSGWYMVQLDYYSPWYTRLPEWHIFLGVVLIFLWTIVIIRIFTHPSKDFSMSYKPWERFLAKWVKSLFYIMVITMLISGYLLTTADGDGYLLFGTIHLPAVSHFSSHQIDTLGNIHQYTSYALMIFVVLHVLGTLKHQLIDNDHTLNRML